MQIQKPFLLNVEQLEDRQMLAGDVTITLNTGQLFVTGDGSSNRIEMISDGETITISGQGTSLNGGEEPIQFSVMSINDYRIDLQDGNDRFTMIANNSSLTAFKSDLSQNAGLNIQTGNGNDRINLIANNTNNSAGFMFDNLFILSDDGNDRIFIHANNSGENSVGFDIHSEAVLLTGRGNNRLNLNASNETGIGFNFNDRASFLTGSGNNRVSFEAENHGIESIGFRFDHFDLIADSGNDRLEFTANNFGDDSTGFVFNPNTQTVISSGRGNDRVELLATNSGDSIGFDATDVADFTILTREGNDRLSLTAKNSGASEGFAMRTNTFISTGEGDDRVKLDASNTGNNGKGINFRGGIVQLFTSTGRDRLSVVAQNRDGSNGLIFNDVNVSAGSEDDRVQFRANPQDSEAGIVVGGDLAIATDEGDDSLTLNLSDGTSIEIIPSATLSFDGGTGDRDRLKSNAESTSLSITNFEIT